MGSRQYNSSSRIHTTPNKAWARESVASRPKTAEATCIRSSSQHHCRAGAPAAPSKVRLGLVLTPAWNQCRGFTFLGHCGASSRNASAASLLGRCERGQEWPMRMGMERQSAASTAVQMALAALIWICIGVGRGTSPPGSPTFRKLMVLIDCLWNTPGLVVGGWWAAWGEARSSARPKLSKQHGKSIRANPEAQGREMMEILFQANTSSRFRQWAEQALGQARMELLERAVQAPVHHGDWNPFYGVREPQRCRTAAAVWSTTWSSRGASGVLRKYITGLQRFRTLQQEPLIS